MKKQSIFKPILTILFISAGFPVLGQTDTKENTGRTNEIKILGRMPNNHDFIIISNGDKVGVLQENNNEKCDTILKCEFDGIQPFENRANNNWFYVRKNGLMGYFSNSHEVLPIKYKKIEYLPDASTYEFKATLPNGSVKYFDYTGKDLTMFGKNGYTIVYSDDWDSKSKTFLDEPIAYVVKKNNRIGVINKTGKILIPIAYDDFTFMYNHYVFSKRNKSNSGETLYIYTKKGRLKGSRYFRDGSDSYIIDYWVDKYTN